jgi:hypothetical protein
MRPPGITDRLKGYAGRTAQKVGHGSEVMGPRRRREREGLQGGHMAKCEKRRRWRNRCDGHIWGRLTWREGDAWQMVCG